MSVAEAPDNDAVMAYLRDLFPPDLVRAAFAGSRKALDELEDRGERAHSSAAAANGSSSGSSTV